MHGRVHLEKQQLRLLEANLMSAFSIAAYKPVLINGAQAFSSSASFDAEALAQDLALEISYIVAPPRMRLYEEYSSRIYATYLKYVAPGYMSIWIYFFSAS